MQARVDALLSDRTVKIPLDAKRTSASLKYLFTELVCTLAGGPEFSSAGAQATCHWLPQRTLPEKTHADRR